MQVAAEERSQVGVYSMVLKATRPEYPKLRPRYEFFEVHILDNAPVVGNSPPYFSKVPPLHSYVDPFLRRTAPYTEFYIVKDDDLDELEGFALSGGDTAISSCLDCFK